METNGSAQLEESADVFSGIFESKPSKIICVTVCCVTTPCVVALLYSSK
jgi:hypothetical protein